MATNRLTQEEIVRETVGFYNVNNRAAVEKNNLIGGYSTSKCEYVTPDNRMCAVGRCLTKKGLARVMKTCPDDSAGDLGIKVGLDNVLKKKYTGHDELFWLRLQRLHDNKNYWDEKGLNERGVRQVKDVFGIIL
jgi:hypothetical protein